MKVEREREKLNKSPPPSSSSTDIILYRAYAKPFPTVHWSTYENIE